MTISTQASSVTIGGNGVTTVFVYSFVNNLASNISVTYTSATGVQTILNPSQYTLVLGNTTTDDGFPIGGTVTYPISGAPIASGTTLTITRTLPLTQLVSISNQGNFYPQTIEQMGDILEMQIQQISNTSSEAIHFPTGDTANSLLPSAALRANQALLFDASGNAVVGGLSGSVPISAAMQPVVAAPSINAAVALLGVTPSTFGLPAITGTANALIATTSSPTNFTLQDGTFISFIPTQFNTGSATLQTPDLSVKTLQKPSFSGLVNLIQGDLTPSIPVEAVYNGSVWICLFPLVGYESTVSTNQNITIGNGFTPYVATSACTFTIAQSTTLVNWWYINISALGGPVTIAINGADKINGGSTGVGLTIPQGSSGTLITDANGNLYISGTFNNTSTSRGGFINKFRNPCFDVAQRSAGTFSVTTGTSQYTLDGWINGATGATLSVNQSFNDIGGVYGNFMQLTGASSLTDAFVKQRIESYIAAPLVGNQVTVQFYIYNNLVSGPLTPTLTIKHATAQDNFGTMTTDVSAVSLQTISNGATGIVAYTYACPSGSQNGIEVTLDFGSALGSASSNIYIGYADIRTTPGVSIGLNSSPSAPESRPIFAEIPFNQRYYAKSYDLTTGAGTVTTNGIFIHYYDASSSGTYEAGSYVKFPVTMRVVPTLTYYSPNSGTSGKMYAAANSADVTPTTVGLGMSGFAWTAVDSSSSTNCFMQGHYAASAEL